jgi:hypothetical protein
VTKAGVKNILFYNNEPSTWELSGQNIGLEGIGMVSAQTGERWVNLAASGANITLQMISKKYAKAIFINETNPQTGGQVSEFTAWGPSNELLAATAALGLGWVRAVDMASRSLRAATLWIQVP